MGVYAEHVLPRIVNAACGMKSAEPFRQRVAAGLAGEVVEIGFGSGLNVPHYPSAVTAVSAVEPADVGWKLAGERVRRSQVPVAGPGSTASGCPSPTPRSTPPCRRGRCARSPTSTPRCVSSGGCSGRADAALHRARTGPGREGTTGQRRLEPLNKRVFGGCHLTRPIVDLVRGAGFEVTELDTFYEPGAPRFVAADSLGVAVSR